VHDYVAAFLPRSGVKAMGADAIVANGGIKTLDALILFQK
jgi:hypothetical protein